jgi:hypothetical protein
MKITYDTDSRLLTSDNGGICYISDEATLKVAAECAAKTEPGSKNRMNHVQALQDLDEVLKLVLDEIAHYERVGKPKGVAVFKLAERKLKALYHAHEAEAGADAQGIATVANGKLARLSDKTREYIANAEAKRAKAEAAWQDATADVQSYAVGESGPEDVYLPSAPDYTDVLERIATALEAAQKPQPGWQMDVTYAGGKPVKTLTLWTDTNKPVDKSNPRFTMTVADVEVAAA